MRVRRTKHAVEAPDLAVDPAGLEEFAQSRGLPAEFLAQYGIHIAGDDEWQPGWIAIPYPHLSGLWYTRFRNPGDHGAKYLTPGGHEAHLYNPLHLGPHSSEVWITEGEFDALTLIYLGLPACAVPGAKGFKSVWKLLFEHAYIIAAFDNDDAGAEAASRLSNAFQKGRIFHVPDDFKDVNEWLIGDGPEWLKEDIENWRAEEGIG